MDRGGGGTGTEGAESGVEGAESGVEGAGSGSRGGGKRGHCGRGSGKIGGRNCFFFTRKFIKKMIHNDTLDCFCPYLLVSVLDCVPLILFLSCRR